MDKIFEFDEDLSDFEDTVIEDDLYKLLDYETVNALLKVSTKNGCYFVQTKIDMFYNIEGNLDEDLFCIIEDEPIYIWDGSKELVKSDLKITKVYELLDWRF